MKRLVISFIMVFALILNMNIFLVSAAPVQKSYIVKVNNKAVTYPDIKPYFDKSGHLFVPVDITVAALGGKVTKDATGANTVITTTVTKLKNLYVKPGAVKIIVSPKAVTAQYNGKLVYLIDNKTKSLIVTQGKKQRLCVPLIFLTNYMGAKNITLSKDKKTYSISIDLPKQKTTAASAPVGFNLKDVKIPKPEYTVQTDAGMKVLFQQDKPILYKSEIYVPVDVVVKALGGTVTYDKKNSRLATVKKGKTTIVYTEGSNIALLNGKNNWISNNYSNSICARYGKNKALYVPVLFLSKWLGAYYTTIDDKSNIVTMVLTDPFPPTVVKYPSMEELKKEYVNPDIPQNLYTITADCPEKDILKAHYKFVKECGVQRAEEIVNIAKGYEETWNNVDYRNLSDSYKTDLMKYFNPKCWFENADGSKIYSQQFVDNYIYDIKKYTAIQKAKFITDKSLVYLATNGRYRIRGTIQFIYEKPTNKSWLWKGIEVGKWYESEIEVELTQWYCEAPTYASEISLVYPHLMVVK